MRRNHLELYVHLVWATWDRMPLIGPGIERETYRLIESEARKVGCKVLALNGTQDHVHHVISLPATVTIADVVKQVKGVSSKFIAEAQPVGQLFKRQANYGAFTVSRWDLDRVIGYVEGQKAHHNAGEVVEDWERAVDLIDGAGPRGPGD